MKITSESQIVDMNDVRAVYGQNGESLTVISSIKNTIIPELEVLADSDVVRYGDTGTRPLFNKLIDVTEQLVKDLEAFAKNKTDDLQTIATAERRAYEEYLEEKRREEEKLEPMGNIR